VRCAQKIKREGLGKAAAVKVAEVQNMARHVLRIALVLWLSGQL
jgi:predicted amino acid racemase